MTTRRITVADVLEAMEMDNVPLARGTWFKGRTDNVESACILGQCAINLGVTQYAITHLLDKAISNSSRDIIMMNDNHKDYTSMVKYAKETYKGHEDVTVDAESAFYVSKLKSTM